MKMIVHKKMAWLVLVLGSAGTLSFLSACNTIEGAGEDVGAAGEVIADTAEDTTFYGDEELR